MMPKMQLCAIVFAAACALWCAGPVAHGIEWKPNPSKQVKPVAPPKKAPPALKREVAPANSIPGSPGDLKAKAEASRKAEVAKKADAAKKANEARQAEAAKKAEDARKADAARRAEETKKAAEATRSDALVVGSWSGAYADSQKVAFFDPFTADGGAKVETAVHDGQIATIAEKIGGWDVADLDRLALSRLCDDGKLMKLDPADLPNGPVDLKAADDFVAGGIEPCGIANSVWSSLVVFNAAKFKNDTPGRLADLLDVKKFPGKRALPEGPEYTLEIALLADGVKPAEVYTALESDDGVARALAVLDRIRDDIVWWTSAREPLRMLANDDVTMALAFNGRVFTASVVEKQALGRIWDGAIWELDYWAIPKDARNADQALRFVKFATDPKRMAEQSRWFPYAPARKSASGMVGKHAEVDVDMRDFAPTAGERLDNGLRFDAIWWSKHRERIAPKLEAWRKFPDPTPIASDEKPPEPAKPEDKVAPAAAENEERKDGAAAPPKRKPKAANKKAGGQKAAGKRNAKRRRAPSVAGSVRKAQ